MGVKKRGAFKNLREISFGEIGAVDSALNAVVERFEDMKYSTVKITRS